MVCGGIMSSSVDFISIIILLGIVQGFYLAFILLHNRNGNYKANRYLALLLCTVSISILNFFLIRTKMYHVTSFTYKIPMMATLLFGPLIYFYSRSIIHPQSQSERRDWVHLIPFLLVFIRFIPYMLKDEAYKYSTILSMMNVTDFRYEQFEFLFLILFSQVQLWIYLFIVSHRLNEYQKTGKVNDSDMVQMNFYWLRFIVLLFAFVYVTFFLLCFLALKYNYTIAFSALGVVVSISIFLLGYYGLKQATLSTLSPRQVAISATGELSGKPAGSLANGLDNLMKEGKQYTGSGLNLNELSGKTADSLAQKLNKLMKEEKFYTNPDLNLNDLAKRLNTSRNTLSQYLNLYLKTSYIDYINRLRVEEMKHLLLDEKKSYLTIQALAQEAGFTSKTTYNRLFKQFTGVTPSEFRRNNTTEDILSA